MTINGPFAETILVAGMAIAIRENALDGGERLLTVESARFVRQIRLLAYYTPSILGFEDSLVIWGGRRVYIVAVPDGVICNAAVPYDIVTVIPRQRRFVLVTELSVLLLEKTCEAGDALLTHDEVIVDARATERGLIVTDLQGRNLLVDVPEL